MAKLSSIHKLSPQSVVVSELPLDEQADVNELAFHATLDKLVEVFTVENIDSATKIQKMLEIGAEFLCMPNGVLGSAMGDFLEIICAVGDISANVKISDKMPLESTFTSLVLESDKPVAVHDLKNSAYALNNISAENTPNSYIGTQVLTTNGPLGTVSFFSSKPRDNAFSKHDIRILNIIANWTGAIIGTDEQLEFLSHQNEYYQSLFRTVPSMMMLCNADGLILATSNRLCNVIGIEPIKLPGQNCQRYFEPEDRTKLTDALLVGNANRLPLTLCCTNETKLDVELNSNIKSIGSMKGVRMVALVDVSERNMAIKAVEEQNKQLALINKSLNQFAFIASHDLQEPLKKIQQFSHFLEEDLADVMNKEGQHDLDVIVNSAKRMSTLIQDVLQFSSAAKDDLIVTDVDLAALLDEVCADLELRIEETNAQIIISALPVVPGDRSLIRQLFTNLIGNSLKYRDQNRAPVINIDVISTAENIAITVADNGIGFDQELASKAFEPFNRLHTSKEYKGNGIGLSICATVCEKHDWKLSASSQPGAGSKFTILMDLE